MSKVAQVLAALTPEEKIVLAAHLEANSMLSNHATGRFTYEELGRRWGCGKSQAWRIATKKSRLAG